MPSPANRLIEEATSRSRREFLRAAAGVGTGATLLGFSPLKALAFPKRRKVVVVTFGGGARDDETFAPAGQKNIPHLLNTLIPQATFFTQVVNEGILGHYVATASLVTGVYETFNNFAAVSPEHPTVFEYFRRGLGRPATDAWVVAPCNGFNGLGASSSRLYGPAYGAGVILPKHLLAAAVSHPDAGLKNLLQDNFETPFVTPNLSGNEFYLTQLNRVLKLSTADFAAHARTLSSADELSVYIARQLMRELAPSFLWITLHDMDVAHGGAFSLYLDGIRRTDQLCAEIWAMVQQEPEYAGNTYLFILPDFGRDADADASGNGFQHHRTGDPLSRTTWMMALGPGVREGVTNNERVQSIDLVPTLGGLLGFPTPNAHGRNLGELL